MPLFTILTQVGTLDAGRKTSLAESLTDTHVELSGVPRNWVHVVFQEYASGDGFSAGAAAPSVIATVTIRTGRSQEYKHNLLTRIWALLQAATAAQDDQIVIGVQELDSGNAMEMGRVMPAVSPSE